uniref:Uncharacterized protein n=1 Tax=Pristionchus pacificus TaxID=54126 RepID=A0A2A6CCG9_PRIPA|eukprot:PDM75829.1 hypothetical protein PRIPAC_40208 [Pristionchus pacificus]
MKTLIQFSAFASMNPGGSCFEQLHRYLRRRIVSTRLNVLLLLGLMGDVCSSVIASLIARSSGPEHVLHNWK